MTLSTPMFPPAADRLRAFGPGLAMQERLRDTALHDLARLRKEARAEIDRLIQFLDRSDTYVMTEVEEDDEREPEIAEPCLGSLDRAQDQTEWAAGCTDDTEHEHDGREPEDTGIGDRDGLLEQVGWNDWQHTVMA